MIGCLRTRVRMQPIIALYFESETVLKFYNLEAKSQGWSFSLCSRPFLSFIHIWFILYSLNSRSYMSAHVLLNFEDKSVYQKINFLISHIVWVLKRTVSMRQLFWAAKTYVNTDGKINFLISHIVWVLKRTVSMRQLFWAAKTYVNTDGKINFLISHIVWVLKRTVSMRRLFWAAKTFVNTDGKINFLISYIVWVLKRAVSMRRLFWAAKTYVNTDGKD